MRNIRNKKKRIVLTYFEDEDDLSDLFAPFSPDLLNSKTPEPESKTFTDRLKTKYSAALDRILEYFSFRVFNVWRGR